MKSNKNQKNKVRAPQVSSVNDAVSDATDSQTEALSEISEEGFTLEDSLASLESVNDTVVSEEADMDSTDEPSDNDDDSHKKVLISELDNIDPDLLVGDSTGKSYINLGSKNKEISKAPDKTPIDIEPVKLSLDGKKNNYDDEPAPKKHLIKSKGLIFVIMTILVVAIVVAASIFYDAGYRDKLNSPLTINGDKVDSAEFSFMYHYILIENGVDIFAPTTPAMLNGPSEDPNFATTRDYFIDLTAQEMRTTEILYDDAISHGLSIQEKHYTLARAYIDWLSDKADEIGVPLETYIKGVFGNQVDKQVVLNTLAKRYFAEDYSNNEKLIELSATDEQAEEAYLNNRNAYDVVNYKLLRITYEQRDDAFIATADLHAKQIIEAMDRDTSKFEAIAAEYFSGEAKTILEQPDSTLVENVRYSDFTHTDFRDWLFDTERVDGDSTIFYDEDGFPIILVFVSRERQSVALRDVRFAYIPVAAFDGAPGLTNSEAQILAQEIYDSVSSEIDMQEIENRYNDQILNGTLTVTHSNDTYPNKYDGILGSWIFDEARVEGDKVFLATEDGYYVVYLVGISDNPEWYDRVNSFIRMNNYQAFMNELESEYKYSFNQNGLDEIQDVP